MILLSWLRFVGEDRGGALLPLESVDLIAQALIFFLSQPQGSHRVFQHVEQLLDEFASAGICDAVQVQVVKHVAIDSRGETLHTSSVLCLLALRALVQLNGDIFLFYNKSLGDLNVEKLALIMASATPATHAPSGSSSLTEDMGVWGLRPLC